MSVFADAYSAYMKPLMFQFGSDLESQKKAYMVGQLCWNLAISPENLRQKIMADVQDGFKMSDEEFEDFKISILLPMVRRHYEMFPHMHGGNVQKGERKFSTGKTTHAREEKFVDTPRNAPCPCGSGKKHKRCCGKIN